MTYEPENPSPSDELILSFLQGRLSPEARARLEEWRQEAPENEERFRSVFRIWTTAGALDPTEDLSFGPRPTASDLLRRYAEGPEVKPKDRAGREHHETETSPEVPSVKASRLPRWSRWVPRAAAAVVLLVSGYLTADLIRRDVPMSPAVAVQELRTGPNEMTTVRLTDGTVVRLAPNSRLRIRGGGGDRDVWLEGRAFFAVEPSQDTRFSVATPAGDAIVLGTRFELEAVDRAIQAMVVQGRVALSDGVVDVELADRQMLRIENGAASQVTELDLPEMYSRLAWMGQSMAFQRTPLIEVARELSERFDVQISVADPRLGARTVSAWFTDEDFEDVLTVICRAVQARCSVSEGVVVVEPEPRP